MPKVICCTNCARATKLDFEKDEKCEFKNTMLVKETMSIFSCEGFLLKLQDEFLKEKWDELTDIPFDESNTVSGLVLAEDWWVFEKGTDREEIWLYFDKLLSKGLVESFFQAS